jgi:hypothetical protein
MYALYPGKVKLAFSTEPAREALLDPLFPLLHGNSGQELDRYRIVHGS